MKLNLRTRLTLILAVLVFFSCGLTGWLAVYRAKSVIEDEMLDQVKRISLHLDKKIEGDFEMIMARLGVINAAEGTKWQELKAELQRLVTAELVGSADEMGAAYHVEGRDWLVAVKEPPGGELFLRQLLRRVHQLENKNIWEEHLFTENGVQMIVRPLIRNDQIIGHVFVWRTIEPIENLVDKLKTEILLVFILTFVMGLAGVFWLSRALLTDVDKIKEGIQRLKFDLHSPLPKVGSELEEIAAAIETLSVSLLNLQEASKGLVASRYLDETLQRGLEMIERVFGAKYAAIFLYDEKADELSIKASIGLSREYVKTVRMKKGEGYSGRVMLTDLPSATDDLRRDERTVWVQMVRFEGIVSLLVVPLRGKGGLLGTIEVYTKHKHTFTPSEISLLSSLAHQIGLSVENAMLFEEMQTRAITDRLTGLYNQKQFYELLQSEIAAAQLYKKPLSLLMLDVDFFKQYNDTFGHPAGDRLLKEFARILVENVRPDDIVARYGGEEFAIILRETSLEQALDIAERIRQKVADSRFEGRLQQPSGRITCSIGIAQYPVHAKTLEDLVKRADEALYRAKYNGRNRVAYHLTFMDALLESLPAEEKNKLERLKTMITVINARDRYTFGHSERVMMLACKVGERMGLTAERLNLLQLAAYFHDIGKMEVTKEILCKEGDLTEAEWEQLKQHAVAGGAVVKTIPVLAEAALIIRHHHERYDGSGYPDGLAGDNIPLEARILAVVDAWDAMTSTRVFREAKGPEQALLEIREQSGKQFDPRIVEIFTALVEGGELNGPGSHQCRGHELRPL
ncbi:diguanylate cyclase (GGDEF) domain-containing protein [Carboxydocella thermautotrophica]|nr:diguanylate cyclase (GGDEF) domain-containing protein [Carboxydocella thermautotrophica]